MTCSVNYPSKSVPRYLISSKAVGPTSKNPDYKSNKARLQTDAKSIIYSAIWIQLKCQVNKGDFVCFCGKSPSAGVCWDSPTWEKPANLLTGCFEFFKQATKMLHDVVYFMINIYLLQSIPGYQALYPHVMFSRWILVPGATTRVGLLLTMKNPHRTQA